MELHFAPDLDDPHTAIEAACDRFRGQVKVSRTRPIVPRPGLCQGAAGFSSTRKRRPPGPGRGAR